MSKIHGLNTDTGPEGTESETTRIIKKLHDKLAPIFERGNVARMQRHHAMFDCAVVKYLDRWEPDEDGDDLVACTGTNASTLYVCPVYKYDIREITREEMQDELKR
jgi:hypothetical protein